LPERVEKNTHLAPTRRETLAAGLGLGLIAAPRLVLAEEEDEEKRKRPQPGDLLVGVGADPVPLTAAAVPLGGPQMLVWPFDAASKTVRDGSRLNKVLVLRFDPAGLDEATSARAAGGTVAYSAICPHAGCEVSKWLADSKRLECPCHFSQYDPRAAGAVIGGPAPRPLPALPLKLVDGRLVVARPFTARAGFQQS
jgi:rieske iron-sulfur protein